MADIAHVLPSTISLHPRFSMGLFRPGVQTVNYRNGRSHSRDYGSYTYKTYAIHPSIFTTDNALLAEWEAFWDQINGGEDEAYIMEPLTLAHKLVPCGPITDGSRVYFPTNIVGLTGETVFVDGVPQTSGYTLHSAANLVTTDAEATGSNASSFATAPGTDSVASHISLDGASCLKVVPDGSNSSGTIVSGNMPVTAGQQYTYSAWVYATNAATQEYKVRVVTYTSANAQVATSTSSGFNVARGVWTRVYNTYSVPNPTTAAYSRFVIIKTTTAGTDPHYIDCFGVTPGTYDRWFLPSQAPAFIEFDVAPAAGSRVYVSGTGQRITRCRFDLDTRWTYQQNDNQQVSGIRASEVLEY